MDLGLRHTPSPRRPTHRLRYRTRKFPRAFRKENRSRLAPERRTTKTRPLAEPDPRTTPPQSVHHQTARRHTRSGCLAQVRSFSQSTSFSHSSQPFRRSQGPKLSNSNPRVTPGTTRRPAPGVNHPARSGFPRLPAGPTPTGSRIASARTVPRANWRYSQSPVTEAVSGTLQVSGVRRAARED